MVTITERAGALLSRMQTEQAFATTLRIVAAEGDFVVGTTAPATDDAVLFHEGAPVLRLSSEAATALAGCTLATRETVSGPTLAIIAPGEPAENLNP